MQTESAAEVLVGWIRQQSNMAWGRGYRVCACRQGAFGQCRQGAIGQCKGRIRQQSNGVVERQYS